MTRLYVAVAGIIAFAALIGAAVFVGIRWDDAADANAKTETLERIQDADVSEGNATADDAWLRDFLERRMQP